MRRESGTWDSLGREEGGGVVERVSAGVDGVEGAALMAVSWVSVWACLLGGGDGHGGDAVAVVGDEGVDVRLWLSIYEENYVLKSFRLSVCLSVCLKTAGKGELSMHYA